MTAVDLDALDELREAATPGPWEVTDGQHEPGIHELGIWSKGLSRYVVEEFAPRGEVADAALIVAAVNALPELLAEVRRGRALREAVEDVAYDLRDHVIARGKPQGGSYDDGVNRAQAAVASDLLAVVAAVDGGGQQ